MNQGGSSDEARLEHDGGRRPPQWTQQHAQAWEREPQVRGPRKACAQGGEELSQRSPEPRLSALRRGSGGGLASFKKFFPGFFICSYFIGILDIT